MFKARCCFTVRCRRHGKFLGGRGSFSAEVEQGTFLVKAADQISQIDGQARVVIERVTPEIDGGRFPIKRVPNESVDVQADIFADGHDIIAAVLKWRGPEEEAWRETVMRPIENDRWQAAFVVRTSGFYAYTIQGWVDRFRTWRRDLEKKFAAGFDIRLELQAGAEILAEALAKANGADALELKTAARAFVGKEGLPISAKVELALSTRIAELMDRFAPRRHVSRYRKELPVIVDPLAARFSAWYELFPRSCSSVPGRHGTFDDCAKLLPRIAEMGFDIVYLPPIHPIGRTHRKGRNNHQTSTADDPGSPWAMGSAEGGHKSIHPELGTLEDFRSFVKAARGLNMQVALDIAFQCSPDHPWVREHPSWFRKRPDGSIQYAENPPKKYEDIYPINFETEDWQVLWLELKSVFEYWITQGVHIFRVDNPHTKSFRFWEWCLGELKRSVPELIFLAEAFTRPKVMYQLAKLGFTQSYNYFPWRNTRWELIQYFTELRDSGVREYFRPNLWPNTPDILPQYLQYGGRAAFMARLILAATLGASYGIYGPAFELCESRPREPEGEEYLDSEKYEIKAWQRDAPASLGELVRKVNQIRRQNPALQSDDLLHFHSTDNEQLIAYSKETPDGKNIIVTIVNLDPHHTQRGWVQLDLHRWGLNPGDTYQVHELLTEARYLWGGARNYVELNPLFLPAHIMVVRRHVRRENDFDYFL